MTGIVDFIKKPWVLIILAIVAVMFVLPRVL